MAGLALIIMAVFTGLMHATVFDEVGAHDYKFNDLNHNEKITGNFLGLAFLTG